MFLVLVFQFEEQLAVLGKENRVFVLEACLQVISVKDTAELPQELETVLNVYDDIKVSVNVSCERVLNVRYFNIKFDEISI